MKYKTNFISLFLLQLSNYFFMFLTVPYLSRILSVEHYGVIFLALSFASYFNIICDYGFNLSGVQQTALLNKRNEDLNKLFSAITSVKIVLLFVCVVIGIVVICMVPRLTSYSWIYLISLGGILNSVFFPVWLFQGLERMKYITVINVLIRGSTVMLVFLLVKQDSQFYLVPIFNVMSVILGCLVAQLIVYNQLAIRYVKIQLQDIIFQFKESWHLFISNIATTMYGTSNSFLLGIIVSPVAVAYYATAEKVIAAVISFIGIMSQTLFPSIVRNVADDKNGALIVLRRNLLIFAVVGAVLSLAILGFSNIIVTKVLGSKYLMTIEVLQILSVIPFVTSINNVLATQTMIPFGFKKTFSHILIFIGILNLCLIFILVPNYSYIGSAYAVVISEVLMPILMLIALYKKGIYILSAKVVDHG